MTTREILAEKLLKKVFPYTRGLWASCMVNAEEISSDKMADHIESLEMELSRKIADFILSTSTIELLVVDTEWPKKIDSRNREEYAKDEWWGHGVNHGIDLCKEALANSTEIVRKEN